MQDHLKKYIKAKNGGRAISHKKAQRILEIVGSASLEWKALQRWPLILQPTTTATGAILYGKLTAFCRISKERK